MRQIFLLMLVGIWMGGCTLVQGWNRLGLNMDKNASIVIITKEVTEFFQIKEASATLYFKNIQTNKEYTMVIRDGGLSDVLAINLPVGNYRIDRWVYDACRTKVTDKYGNYLHCQDYYRFKGKTAPLIHNQFTIKAGERLYLGHVKFEIVSGMLSWSNRGVGDIQLIATQLGFNPKEIKNIANQLDIEYWKFEPTGYKTMWEW